MCKYESINITPAENDGFVIRYREKPEMSSMKNSGNGITFSEEKTLVGKDSTQTIKLLKGMLNGDGSDDDKSGMMKNAY